MLLEGRHRLGLPYALIEPPAAVEEPLEIAAGAMPHGAGVTIRSHRATSGSGRTGKTQILTFDTWSFAAELIECYRRSGHRPLTSDNQCATASESWLRAGRVTRLREAVLSADGAERRVWEASGAIHKAEPPITVEHEPLVPMPRATRSVSPSMYCTVAGSSPSFSFRTCLKVVS